MRRMSSAKAPSTRKSATKPSHGHGLRTCPLLCDSGLLLPLLSFTGATARSSVEDGSIMVPGRPEPTHDRTQKTTRDSCSSRDGFKRKAKPSFPYRVSIFYESRLCCTAVLHPAKRVVPSLRQ